MPVPASDGLKGRTTPLDGRESPVLALDGTELPKGAAEVLACLEGAGFEAWVVGGWVRDALMGRPSHDVDLCCSAPWQKSAAALRASGIKVIESGIRFVGITAVASTGEHVEVTTYRVDGFYTDGRHPEEVRVASSVEEDLARRDFTVNAMAWHPARGLLDLFGGVEDMRAGRIKAVGEARRRFEEDALRMLRAVRFACRLGFSFEDETHRALESCAPLLRVVARERVGTELSGILATGRAGWALRACPELMCEAVPELAACRGFEQCTRYHAYDVYEHIARVLEALGDRARDKGVSVDLSTAWAALYHDAAKPSCFTRDEKGRGHFYGHPHASALLAQKAMRRLGVADRTVREASTLIRYHDMPVTLSREGLLKLFGFLSVGGLDVRWMFDALVDLRCADALGKASFCFSYVDDLERLRVAGHDLLDRGEAYSLRQLDLDGAALIERGVKPGPRMGELLQRALDDVVAGKVPNERAALLEDLGLL